jgi:hypothetical protein
MKEYVEEEINQIRERLDADSRRVKKRDCEYESLLLRHNQVLREKNDFLIQFQRTMIIIFGVFLAYLLITKWI